MYRLRLLVLVLATIASCEEEIDGECEERILEVESMEWRDGADYPNEIAEKRRPLLLTGTPASRWNAIGKWGDVEYLDEHLPHILENSYRSENSSEFSYLSISEDQLVDLPRETWLASLYSEEFTMYSAPLLRCCNTMLEDLIDDTSSPDLFSLDDVDSEMTAWFGTEGITTAIHCDMFQHNFFVQIAGRKSFELWHPKSHFELYLHSSLLPQARESRVRDQNDTTRYPDFAGIRPAVVNLNPGDVLYALRNVFARKENHNLQPNKHRYIPPHYFHRVTSRRDSNSRLSVSLSIWTERESERKVLDVVRSLPLPLESNWSEKKLRDMAAIFLLDVVRETIEQNEPRKFVNRLVRSRHGMTCEDHDVLTQDSNDSGTHAQDIAKALRMLHVDVIEIHLADYIEEVASYVVNLHQDRNISNGLSRVATYLCQI